MINLKNAEECRSIIRKNDIGPWKEVVSKKHANE
jgi:hypothetical protein